MLVSPSDSFISNSALNSMFLREKKRHIREPKEGLIEALLVCFVFRSSKMFHIIHMSIESSRKAATHRE